MLDSRWGLLYVQLNRENISDPDFIQEGQKLRIPYSQEQLYGQFDSAIDGQSHSSGCCLDTCSCCGLHAGETVGKAGTVSFSTAGGVHRLSGDD